MTTSHNSSVLKDVVAYVDVWSSDKTANYSKPFVQQLQEMGAQVSKTFNKQVTHVVFNNGHPATWRKAKKTDVTLVSVLWVGRCYDDGVHVDEGLYPALNDESNPVLKNKKHRCMQPKDSPERTPENDKRMKRKLDKMMKDLAPKQPLVTDVSPIIIDEENGIVYSPALKRSNYMAQRLKDMKEKRENLSPTASQMVESCSPTKLKPSIGSTPTVLKLMFDQSDDDSSASAAEPGCSPDKEEGRTKVDVTDHGCVEKRHRKDSAKLWLSPCREVPKTISSPLRCPDKEDEAGTRQKKTRSLSVRKEIEKKKSVRLLEIPCQDTKSDNSKTICKEKRRSQIKSTSPKPEKGKQKSKADKTFTETKPSICPNNVNFSSCLLSPATSGGAEVELSKVAASVLQKTPKRARPSLSSLVRSVTVSAQPHSVASVSTDGDDNVFEDYFSPANHQHRSKKPLLKNLPVETDIQIPFELNSVPKKRKQRRSESIESETIRKKKRKVEESQSGKNPHQWSDASRSSQQDVKESLPALDSSSASVTLMAKRPRRSTLPLSRAGTTTSDAVKQRPASVQSAVLTEDKPVSQLEKGSGVGVQSHTLESRGNECTVAAGSTEILSEGDIVHNQKISRNLQKLVKKTKGMRTLVMTSLPSEKQTTLIQVVKTLGGFIIVDCVCESTTHVVSGGHRRTLNILLGIARGCWILSFEWILWCLEQRHWIPEEPYELSDQFPAAQICRLQRHLSAGEHQQDLFQDQPTMFVSQYSQPPTQCLMELIQLCGGTVCKTMRQAGICIGRYSGRRPKGSRILSEQWVLDSITHLKQLSYDNYDLE
ncbi:microcephalin isoform X1 [Hippoglossus hippoglossus]|uniref:microcephalin isoform X1 n=1 Tax=Hippoglossus hippoglossus TaxID=8267 RepID=UPI00148D7AA0|nr:microcephalin isoform X1 [Hippoglossus hippoglossus]